MQATSLAAGRGNRQPTQLTNTTSDDLCRTIYLCKGPWLLWGERTSPAAMTLPSTIKRLAVRFASKLSPAISPHSGKDRVYRRFLAHS
jgi:hypothetical protein